MSDKRRRSNKDIAELIQKLEQERSENNEFLFKTFIDALSNKQNKDALEKWFENESAAVIKRAVKVIINEMPATLAKAEQAIESETRERTKRKASEDAESEAGASEQREQQSFVSPTGI